VNDLAKGCHRSHPHEDMDAECERLTRVARQNNAAANGSGWRIFKLNDCDWWIARSIDEAKASFQKECGPMPDDEAFDEPCELTDADMDTLKIAESDENERRTGKFLTFREYLIERIGDGLDSPEMFASTEW
jgi:hypothetical protein